MRFRISYCCATVIQSQSLNCGVLFLAEYDVISFLFSCRKAGAAAVEEGEGEGIQELFEEAEYNLKQSVLKRLADAREGRTEDKGLEEDEEKIEETDDLGESALCRNY